MNPESSDTLTRLLRPLTREAFLDTYWESRCLHIEGDPRKLEGLFGDAVERLLRRLEAGSAVPSDARVVGFVGGDASARYRADYDTTLTQRVPSSRLEEALSEGTTAQLRTPGMAFPPAGQLAAELHHGLGGAVRFKPRLWISSPGAGLPTHLDEFAVLQIQLAGRKRWRISSRAHTKWPSGQATARPDGMALMPDGTEVQTEDVEYQEFVASPGDVVYFPAGCWHQTWADGEARSVALGLSVFPLHFIDLVAEAAKSVHGHARWRRPPRPSREAWGDTPSPEEDRHYRGSIDELIAWLEQLRSNPEPLHRTVRKAMAASQLEHFDRLAPRSSATYRPPPGVRVAAAASDDRTRSWLYAGPAEVELEPPLLEFAARVAREQEFTAEEAASWVEAGALGGSNNVAAVLEGLTEAGILVGPE